MAGRNQVTRVLAGRPAASSQLLHAQAFDARSGRHGSDMGGNWEKSRCGDRVELRSSASNCTAATCRFDVFAGHVMIRPTLGVKGSQVQILSSRRSEEARSIWTFAQVGGLFRALVSIFVWSRNGNFTILVNGV
jgi:hypothetical protein